MVNVTVIPAKLTLSDTVAANVGTAAAGSGTLASRYDHVHAIPNTHVSNAMLAGSIAYAKLVGTDIGVGSRTTIFGSDYSSIGQGTWAYSMTASQIRQGYFENTSTADGDNISFQTYLGAGTYTLYFITYKTSACGIVDIDIDGGEVASFDLYAAGDTFNTTVNQASIAVATSGIKTIRVRLDGKHGSSSDYICPLSYIILVRTA